MKVISRDDKKIVELIEMSDIGKELKWLGKITEKDVGKRVYTTDLIKDIDDE